ncbi:PAS domain S-box-containing protein [Abditibacterium utsteinense]|uniref:histidine kinase n=1 Tax=Abditibacterium utsteinense TaxID=1960156 RepID=A0A2S8SQP5_9BACT|nr:PAS domain S-box protein [Abditibacterium utsteinense]PQV63131.1 PAS domain S-box-containing protein [Abditibacterium utsteinense]
MSFSQPEAAPEVAKPHSDKATAKPDAATKNEASDQASAEANRLKVLQAYQILDTPAEASFDRITSLAARVFRVPVSFISLVDEERQWFKSCYGSNLQETARDISFCSVALQKSEVMIVPDARLDARFAQNPLVTGPPLVRFYAGAPLLNRDGVALGALCIIDTEPRDLDESERATLRDLAAVVVDELELRLVAERLTQEATARRNAQKALQDSENRFQSAFEMSATGMALVSLQGRWLQVNDCLCQMLGYPQAELLDLTFQEITYRDDLSRDLQLLEQLLAGEIGSYQLEKRYLRGDGQLIWALINVALVRDELNYAPDEVTVRDKASDALYFVVQVQDISARKQIEADLRASEARKTAILETSLDCIITIDDKSRVIEWNPAAEKTLGFSREEALARPLHEMIVPPELRDAHCAGIKRYLSTGVAPILGQRLELPAMRADGKTITVELAIVPIPGSDPPLFTGHLRDISERRAAEERLRLLESVAVNANDAILITEAEPVDLPGPRILYANKAYLEMSGYTLDEILGQTPRILQGEGTLPASRDKIREALKKWKPIAIELLNYKKDGTPFWVELSITPVANEKGWYTHWVSIQRDITERKVTLGALQQSEARYGRIATNVPGMVYQFVLHPDGSFTFPFVSEGCREIYGLEPWQLEANARLVMSGLHPDDAQTFRDNFYRSARTLGAWEWEGRLQLPGREMKWIRGTSRPKREESGEIIWDGILSDITPRKKIEEALLTTKNEAEAAREEAERANLAKSEFLSRMSHELRTPLNAILGFGQLLEMADLRPSDAQSADQIVKAGRHLLGLINEVLDIARIESGHMNISLEAVGAREILMEALDLVRPLAAARRITIDDAQVRNASLYLTADRQRLKQILLNLLSNAVKYNCEAGRVTLHVSLHIEEKGEMVRLGVSDTGKGLTPDLLERIGTPFDRLGAETSGIEGTGVGLALSQRLAGAMNTSLEVESQVGRGTRFWIDLPRALDPHTAPQTPAPWLNAVAATRLVVLYIEDNPSNLQLVQKLLSHRPEIRLLNAMQGDLGLELARSHRPDLILLDMHLPDVSGLEILARLQQNPLTAAIPVVVLSADATPGQVRRALEAGAQSYLPKPLEVRDFFACLDNITSQKIKAMTNESPEINGVKADSTTDSTKNQSEIAQ